MAQNRRRVAVVSALLAMILGSATAAWASTHQHRRSGEPDAEEREAVTVAPNSSTGSCGVERWSVKTGTDADAGAITLASTTPTTIASLDAIAAPSSLPANNRVKPTETTVYQVSATLTQYKLEADSDYHLVLQDSGGRTMIAEIPDPACVGAGSVLASRIQNARNQFDAKYTATGSFKTANVAVTVTGVGFFDFDHGQTGVAPNAIELHAVTNFQLGTVATVSVANPGSQTGTVGTAKSLQLSASGGSTPYTWTATGLPAGMSINAGTGLISGTPTTAASYSSTVTAKDTNGATGSATFGWTISTGSGGCGSPGQKLGNPGFETGTAAPWTASTGVISNSTSEPAHAGSWKAWLDGYGAATTDTLTQSVTIPAGCTATFSFYLHIDTAETSTTTAYDKLTVKIGTTTLATYSNLNKNTGYALKSFNVSSFAGQTVTVSFSGVEDSTLQTSFVVDDTALTLS